VELDFRVWCATGDYWDVFYYVEEEVLRRFRKENITIPYPQLDVHINKEA
jgi:small conductance mechanosensitive channel